MVSHSFSLHRLLMKRKKRISSPKSSPENLPLAKFIRNPMKSKKISSSIKSSQQPMVLHIPYECWECVLSFLVNYGCFGSLSLVSKQFLSITNRLIFSLRVKEINCCFLPRLFKRFTNLNTIDLTHFGNDSKLDDLLSQISNFPLKLTSLKLPDRCCFPADGLQAFSQNIKTLTSLTCYDSIFADDDLSPIVDCFPLLEELNLRHPLVINSNKPIFINSIHSLLSKCPCIQRLELKSTYFLYDQHVDFSLFLGNLVFINLSGCHYLTETTLFSLVMKCPLLSEINMEGTSIGKETIRHSGVYPQLKSLYLGHNSRLSDEIIKMFASIFPNLQLLNLKVCRQI